MEKRVVVAIFFASLSCVVNASFANPETESILVEESHPSILTEGIMVEPYDDAMVVDESIVVDQPNESNQDSDTIEQEAEQSNDPTKYRFGGGSFK